MQPVNRILQKLSPQQLQLLVSRMELVELSAKEVLYEQFQPVEFAFFPEEGVVSIVTPLQDWSALEVATVGNEGMVGLPLVLQERSRATTAVCHISGKAWRISADDLRSGIAGIAGLSQLMLRYAQTMFDSIALISACNALHTIEERCARWLLLRHDRIKDKADTFPVTQELLAQMLGVRRSGVNLAAGLLEKADLITYGRGKVTIRNRKGLEEASCKCYAVVHRALEALDCPRDPR